MSADGTEYQTWMLFAWIRSSMRRPDMTVASSTTTIVAPRDSVAQTSNTDRLKWKGATLATRSPSRSPIASAAQSTKAAALPCESMTPLGMPVDPDV